MRAVRQSDRGGRAADFLHRDHVREITHVGAAVFLLDGNAQHAELAEARPQFIRKFIGAVDGGGARRDFPGGEGGDRFAQDGDGFAESEVESGVMHR